MTWFTLSHLSCTCEISPKLLEAKTLFNVVLVDLVYAFEEMFYLAVLIEFGLCSTHTKFANFLNSCPLVTSGFQAKELTTLRFLRSTTVQESGFQQDWEHSSCTSKL